MTLRRVAAVAAAAVTVLALGSGWKWWRDYHRFDAAQWRAQATLGCHDMSRRRMVGDLRAHSLRPGMTRQEVRALLGTPEFVSPDFVGAGIWWEYMTGPALVDCFTFGVRFVDARVQETSEGQN